MVQLEKWYLWKVKKWSERTNVENKRKKRIHVIFTITKNSPFTWRITQRKRVEKKEREKKRNQGMNHFDPEQLEHQGLHPIRSNTSLEWSSGMNQPSTQHCLTRTQKQWRKKESEKKKRTQVKPIHKTRNGFSNESFAQLIAECVAISVYNNIVIYQVEGFRHIEMRKKKSLTKLQTLSKCCMRFQWIPWRVLR